MVAMLYVRQRNYFSLPTVVRPQRKVGGHNIVKLNLKTPCCRKTTSYF